MLAVEGRQSRLSIGKPPRRARCALHVGPLLVGSVTRLGSVTRGFDPRVHLLAKKMDCRVKPGNDRSRYHSSSPRSCRTLDALCHRDRELHGGADRAHIRNALSRDIVSGAVGGRADRKRKASKRKPDHSSIGASRRCTPISPRASGNSKSTMAAMTRVAISVLLKKIPSEPWDISIAWRKASSALSPITIASTRGASG